MELPIAVRTKIEEIANGYKISELRQISEKLTDSYMNNSGKGNSFVSTELEALTYAIVRMPATYSSVSSALFYALENCNFDIKTVLDVGAGVGTASIAVHELIKNDLSITCLERESAMVNLGKKLTEQLPIVWRQEDFVNAKIEEKYDLVIASYSLNELSDIDRRNVVNKLFDLTNKLLLIVEPGTTISFNQLKEIREYLIAEGGNVVAPCLNNEKCPMCKGDWCHFSSRIQRSKLHKLVKGVDVPFEDEKYSYIAISKEPVVLPDGRRILRHPIIGKSNISLEFCCKNGIKEEKIFKNSPLYKKAKKTRVGDLIKE